MVYLQSTLKLYPDKLPAFIEVMNAMLPALGRHGWKLVGSYATMVGRLHTVLDLWELPDLAAFQAAFADPEVMQHAPRVREAVEDEVLSFMSKLPIG